MKKLVTLFIYLISLTTFSQNQDYFIVNKEKTYCSDLSFEITSQSYLKSISYTDSSGKKIEIEGRKKVPNISTFYINGNLIDKIPQKVDKPKKYIKWAKRVVDGKLIVNYYHSEMTTSNWYSDGDIKDITTGITKHFVKMPNGTYYDIRSSKDRKKHIIPYLKRCANFKSQYKGDFNKRDFNEIITLYNQVCE